MSHRLSYYPIIMIRELNVKTALIKCMVCPSLVTCMSRNWIEAMSLTLPAIN